MKKIIGKISWIVAILGTIAVALTTVVIDNYVLFYAGIAMMILGIIVALLTGEKTKEAIWKLLDFI